MRDEFSTFAFRDEISLTLGAGKSTGPLGTPGNYIYLIDSDGSLDVSIDGGAQYGKLEAGRGFNLRDLPNDILNNLGKSYFTSIAIKNNNSSAVRFRLEYGFGTPIDNRLTSIVGRFNGVNDQPPCKFRRTSVAGTATTNPEAVKLLDADPLRWGFMVNESEENYTHFFIGDNSTPLIATDQTFAYVTGDTILQPMTGNPSNDPSSASSVVHTKWIRLTGNIYATLVGAASAYDFKIIEAIYDYS